MILGLAPFKDCTALGWAFICNDGTPRDHDVDRFEVSTGGHPGILHAWVAERVAESIDGCDVVAYLCGSDYPSAGEAHILRAAAAACIPALPRSAVGVFGLASIGAPGWQSTITAAQSAVKRRLGIEVEQEIEAQALLLALACHEEMARG